MKVGGGREGMQSAGAAAVPAQAALVFCSTEVRVGRNWAVLGAAVSMGNLCVRAPCLCIGWVALCR